MGLQCSTFTSYLSFASLLDIRILDMAVSRDVGVDLLAE